MLQDIVEKEPHIGPPRQPGRDAVRGCFRPDFLTQPLVFFLYCRAGGLKCASPFPILVDLPHFVMKAGEGFSRILPLR